MKLSLTATALLFLCAPLHAQITILSTDMPVIGDVITRYVDTIPSIGPGGAGPMQQWDFSSAIPHLTVVTSVSAPASTPYASDFTSSNLAMTNDGSVYAYFNNGPSIMTINGAAGDLLGNGTIASAPLNPDLTLHQFPRNYGDGFTDAYYSEVVADGSAFGVYQVRARRHGSVLDATDSHGDMTTPVGTYDCLRVHTTAYTVDSFWTKLLSFLPWTFVSAASDTMNTYTWLAQGTKLPAAELTVDNVGAPLRFTYSSIGPLSTGFIASGIADAELLVWPQPATDHVCVRWPDAQVMRITSATIMDLHGRVVKQVAMVPPYGRIEMDGLPAGTFLLQVEGRNGIKRTARLVRVDAP